MPYSDPVSDDLMNRLLLGLQFDILLDVGAGDGRLSRHVAPLAREVVVSDVSPTMVREAGENLESHSNVTTHLARGVTLDPLPAASFDVVFAQGVLSYLEVNQGLALLDEMATFEAAGVTDAGR